MMRGVEERLTAYRNNPSKVAGRCAERVYQALQAPWQGLPDATAVARAVPKGKMMSGRAPRGAIVYWDGGAAGHGHCCFALGDGTELSVDVIDGKPGVAGVVPFSWFAKNWGNLRYLGWSWYWGKHDTQPAAVEVVPPAGQGTTTTGKTVTWWRDFSGKPKDVQSVPADNRWHVVDGIDVAPAPLAGREDHFLYTRLVFRWSDPNAGHAECSAKWVRDGGTPDDPSDDDGTAYTEAHFRPGTDTVPFDQPHFEEGEAGVGGVWCVRFTGRGLRSVDITTRYAKTYVLAIAP